MNLVLSLIACFASVEAGALVVCIGIMILDSGLLSVLEGVAVWAIAQPVILPIALLSSPVGALLRMVLGLVFEQPAKVAMTAGVAVGIIGAAAFAHSTKDGVAAWGPILLIGSLAGFCGGLPWWRIEKPYLDRLNTERQR
ncbi:hypothetical protein [Mameliella sediminis]|uniref:hypothetical protein n=1 Tax=Mameliella sediminis TaxID=2836866 RepID=UPI001C4862F5|nr:hypothetical protein [Mameliella sediminis]MBV7393106.1 hypothetical protein [Mameliella sediminis]